MQHGAYSQHDQNQNFWMDFGYLDPFLSTNMFKLVANKEKYRLSETNAQQLHCFNGFNWNKVIILCVTVNLGSLSWLCLFGWKVSPHPCWPSEGRREVQRKALNKLLSAFLRFFVFFLLFLELLLMDMTGDWFLSYGMTGDRAPLFTSALCCLLKISAGSQKEILASLFVSWFKHTIGIT